MKDLIEFTHYAKFWGIPCYMNVDTGDVMGTNFVFTLLILVCTWIDMVLPSNGQGFMFTLIRELEGDDKFH